MEVSMGLQANPVISAQAMISHRTVHAAAPNISHPRSGQGSDDDSIRPQEECWDVQVVKTLEVIILAAHLVSAQWRWFGFFFVLSKSVLSAGDAK